MANNNMEFSTVIGCAAEEERNWLITKLESEEGQELAVDYEEADTSFDLIVFSESSGDAEGLAALVVQFQEHFKKQEPWVLEFALTCSKPRVGEFGGGAVVVYKGKEHWMNSGQWSQEKVKELTA